jgi:hypothetical protein
MDSLKNINLQEYARFYFHQGFGTGFFYDVIIGSIITKIIWGLL